MITLEQYWMGRDKLYPHKLGSDIKANALRTVAQVNQFLALAAAQGKVDFELHPVNKSLVSSGWRPSEINSGITNAKPRSNHIMAKACDVYDPDGDIDNWAITKAGLRALEQCGLWLEHPSATRTWCHLQIVSPRSGRRVFYP